MMSVNRLRYLLREHDGRRVVCEYSVDEPGLAIYDDAGSYIDFIPLADTTDDPDPEIEGLQDEREPDLADHRELWIEEWVKEHQDEIYRRPKGEVLYRVIGGHCRDGETFPFSVKVRRSSDSLDSLMLPSDFERMVQIPPADLTLYQALRLGLTEKPT